MKKRKKIHALNTDITYELTHYEHAFLKALILSKEGVPFDRLADVIYKSKADVKYSLWGITKIAQRVRDKLEKFGLPRSIIHNIKGEGFSLSFG